MQLRRMNSPGDLGGSGVSRPTRWERHDRTNRDTPGPRGADAVRTLARFVTGRPLEACIGLFARYGDTVYLPVRPWEGLYIFSRPEQAEHVLAASQGNYVKPFTCRPLPRLLGVGLLTPDGTGGPGSARSGGRAGPQAGAGGGRGGAGGDGGGPRDLRGLLMAARDSDGSGLRDQEVRDGISTFLVAGHETTAVALTWSLALL